MTCSKENGSAVDDRGFTFLIILAAIVCYHLYAIPDKSLWAGDLQLSPVLYSVGGLVGQGLIAILYGAPYSAIVINGIGSSVAFILGLAGLAGLYDWVGKYEEYPIYTSDHRCCPGQTIRHGNGRFRGISEISWKQYSR
ncbi:unnamed protein product [Adineta ricciae]|uniref:Uncharacterized protein n=1 Tax=Adineta ricciae TaxID=249248 RepID=A0A815G0C7_ADIRI|nr:unnamed protein product [Adineta ricciae]